MTARPPGFFAGVQSVVVGISRLGKGWVRWREGAPFGTTVGALHVKYEVHTEWNMLPICVKF